MLIYIFLPIMIFVAGALATLGIFKLNKLEEGKSLKIFKILSLFLALVYVVFFMSDNNEIETTVALMGGPLNNSFLSAVCALLLWFTLAAGVIAMLQPFFPKIKANRHLIRFFVLPVAVLDIIFFYWLSIAAVGTGAFEVFNYRILFLALTIALLFAISVSYTFRFFKEKMEKSEVFPFVLACLGILIASLPVDCLRVIFGPGPMYKFIDFTFYHRMILYLAFVIPSILYFALKKKDVEVRRYVCIFISIATLTAFSRQFTFMDLQKVTNWPFHLCSTAMYMLPLTLIFKMKRLFYFTLFINVLGAFLAMFVPNYAALKTIFEPGFYAFLLNHYIAFFMPFLIVALGIFERPKWKHFAFSMMSFMVYFVTILFINAWFSNYDSVDYFFVNSDFIAAKLGLWAEKLREFTWEFNIGDLHFVLYPLYQFLFYLVYAIAGLGMWFIYENGFQIADSLGSLFNSRKKIKFDNLALKSQMEGRNIHEPVNLKGVDMIKINNFSKRYGNSKSFAVENANLEIKKGEIFGFLGPNGAGKSTIIKSLVGIQPITSGSIEICGYDIEKQGVEAKRNIGFVPDHYALYERLTGREYINYIADLYRVKKEDRNKRIAHFLDIFELSYAFDSQIRTYSHGMKQKIAIMAALVHNPKVWILDEPLTGLDPNSIYQVKETMKEHAKAGNIVFFSSHIIDVVEKLCTRIAIISKGEILVSATLKELKKQKISLEEFYIRHVGKKGGERS